MDHRLIDVYIGDTDKNTDLSCTTRFPFVFIATSFHTNTVYSVFFLTLDLQTLIFIAYGHVNFTF